jgi:hypothetical protein
MGNRTNETWQVGKWQRTTLPMLLGYCKHFRNCFGLSITYPSRLQLLIGGQSQTTALYKEERDSQVYSMRYNQKKGWYAV